MEQKMLAPDGSEYIARTAREVNDLIFGAGYRVAPEPPKAPAPEQPKAEPRPR